jgi:hypothetical protein
MIWLPGYACASLGVLIALAVTANGAAAAEMASDQAPPQAVTSGAAPTASDRSGQSAQAEKAAPPTGTPVDVDYFSNWRTRVRQAQASQPHWMTPIATVTPRLEEEFRYDEFWQHSGNGANLDNIDGGKGLELIPTTSNEVLINLPPYEERTVKKPVNGYGDWQFLVIKQRFISANEENGSYIVTGFLGFQAPTGSAAFTNHAWVITPTLAAGKGWGIFDVQGTVGVQLPMSRQGVIGTAVVSNVAFQAHLAEFLWPEIEVNDTYWSGGQRSGKNQVLLTPGVIFGRFQVTPQVKAIFGVGYQVAISPKIVRTPVLTPTYQNAVIMTLRGAF